MGIVVDPLHTWDFNPWGHSTVLSCAVLNSSTSKSAFEGNTCISLLLLDRRGGGVPQAYVCGVEVLLGYCCDKPGELQSHSARPVLSTGTIWRTQCLEVLTPCWDPAWALSVPAALG